MGEAGPGDALGPSEMADDRGRIVVAVGDLDSGPLPQTALGLGRGEAGDVEGEGRHALAGPGRIGQAKEPEARQAPVPEALEHTAADRPLVAGDGLEGEAELRR